METDTIMIADKNVVHDTKKTDMIQNYENKVNQIIACNDKDTDILLNISQSYTARPKDFKQIKDNYFELPSRNVDQLTKLYIDAQADNLDFGVKICMDTLPDTVDPNLSTNFIERSCGFQGEISAKFDKIIEEKSNATKKVLFEQYEITSDNQKSQASTDYNEAKTQGNALKFIESLQENKNLEELANQENQMVNEFQQKLNFKPTYTKKEDRTTIDKNTTTKNKVDKNLDNLSQKNTEKPKKGKKKTLISEMLDDSDSD